ncbi:MAG: ATP-binding protein [Halobacteriales archaeon]
MSYHKNGRTFWNKLDIAPISGHGDVTHFVGFQTDITERKIREQRLTVLNRVLSHNLRNVMSVIQGHAELLEDEVEGEEPAASLEAVNESAENLMALADTVRDIESTVQAADAMETVIPLNQRVQELLSAMRDRYPEATFDLTLPEEGCEVAVTGIVAAVEEAIENAVTHNDSPDPSIEIRVHERDGWVDVETEDDGPGIPEREITAIREGETALSHADRLGLWLIYWVVSKAGGSLSVSAADPRGTILTLSVPAEG